jgi:hypothetical protein
MLVGFFCLSAYPVADHFGLTIISPMRGPGVTFTISSGFSFFLGASMKPGKGQSRRPGNQK